MINQAEARGEFLMMAVPTAPNGGLGPNSSDPLMFGSAANNGGLAGVAQSSYTPPTGIANPEGIGVQFVGAFFLSVIGASTVSPLTGLAINPGDKVYATGGTLDATTGCYYGFTLSADSSGRYFGNALDAVVSAQTTTIRVRLKVTG